MTSICPLVCMSCWKSCISWAVVLLPESEEDAADEEDAESEAPDEEDVPVTPELLLPLIFDFSPRRSRRLKLLLWPS